MKKILVSFYLSNLLFAQGPLPQTDYIPLIAPAPPSVMVNSISTRTIGAVGSTIYYYWVVAQYPIGQAKVSGPIVVTNANAVLDGVNYVNISWTELNNVTSYTVLRTNTSNIPTGTGNYAVCTNVIGISCNDQSNIASSYTVDTVNNARGAISFDNLNYPEPRIVIDRAISGGTDLLTFTANNVNAVDRTVESKLQDIVSVKDFGATGLIGQDATKFIQNALNDQPKLPNTSGMITFPPGQYTISASLKPNSFSKIQCARGAVFYASSNIPIFDITNKAGVIIDSCGLVGLNQSGSKGIYGTNVNSAVITNNILGTFGDQAIQINGIAGLFEHNIVSNGGLIRTGRITYIGACEFSGTDMKIINNECGAGFDYTIPGQYDLGWIVACYINSINGDVRGNICQVSQQGMIIEGSKTTYISNRADRNQGNGFNVISTGASNILIGNEAYDNSRDTNNTYDGFIVTGFNNTLIGNSNRDELLGGITRYSFNDNATAAGNPNTWVYNTDDFNNKITITNGGKPLQLGSDKFPVTTETSDVIRAGSLYLKGSGRFGFWADGADVDNKLYQRYINAGGGFSQLIERICNDNVTVCTTWLQLYRTGTTANRLTIGVDNVELQNPTGGGTTPTITNDFGTGATITGKNAFGRIVVGAGGIDTTGTVTFATPNFRGAPACYAQTSTISQTTPFAVTTTPSTLIITSSTPFVVGDIIKYGCGAPQY